jgi:hypothetical protein
MTERTSTTGRNDYVVHKYESSPNIPYKSVYGIIDEAHRLRALEVQRLEAVFAARVRLFGYLLAKKLHALWQAVHGPAMLSHMDRYIRDHSDMNPQNRRYL